MGRFRRKRTAEAPPVADGFWPVPHRFNFARDVVEELASDPQRRALTFVDREGVIDRRSFREIAGEAARWAALLRSRGLEPGDPVLVTVSRTSAWPASLLGALKAGLVAVPCPATLAPQDLVRRAEHASASLALVERAQALALAEAGVSARVVIAEDVVDELGRLSIDQPTHDTVAEDIALVLYAPDTTSTPRGAVHTHGYTWATGPNAEHWLDVRADDTVWPTAEAGSAEWTRSVLGSWSRGAEIVIHAGAPGPEECVELVGRLGVTVLCRTATEYRAMAEHASLQHVDAGDLRHAVSLGAPLDPAELGAFRESFGLTVCNAYGPVETAVLVADGRGTGIKPGSLGLPAPGHRVAVVDDGGREQPPGVEGDIAVHGRPPTLLHGYWNAAEQPSAFSRGDWRVVGARATRDEEGYFWLREPMHAEPSEELAFTLQSRARVATAPSTAPSTAPGAVEPGRGTTRTATTATERSASNAREDDAVSARTAAMTAAAALVTPDEPTHVAEQARRAAVAAAAQEAERQRRQQAEAAEQERRAAAAAAREAERQRKLDERREREEAEQRGKQQAEAGEEERRAAAAAAAAAAAQEAERQREQERRAAAAAAAQEAERQRKLDERREREEAEQQRKQQAKAAEQERRAAAAAAQEAERQRKLDERREREEAEQRRKQEGQPVSLTAPLEENDRNDDGAASSTLVARLDAYGRRPENEEP